MKRLIATCMLAALLCLAGCAGSGSGEADSSAAAARSESAATAETASTSEEPSSNAQANEEESNSATEPGNKEVTMLNIQVGDATLQATWEDNSSAEALAALLEYGPITLSLHDYGNFEKVGPLPTSLPTNDTQITTTPGDVILYQGNQLTIYYDVNSWSFTRLAHIDGATTESLLEVLGDGDVEVTLSV